MKQTIQYGLLLLGILATITLFISIYFNNSKIILEGLGSLPITGLTQDKPPIYVKDLQPFVTQFLTTQTTMDDITRSNVATLQNLLTVSINTYTANLQAEGKDVGDAHFLTTDNIPLLWDSVANSQLAYTHVLDVFLASPPPLDESSSEKYKPDNLDVEYHSSVSDIAAQQDAYGLSPGTAYVYDQNGNKVALPPGVMANNTTYYQPGTYKYSATTYVPSYEDSVYLSKSTGLTTMVAADNSTKSDLCEQYKDDPIALENACQGMDNKSCSSSSCCVLLGGVKCVSGDEYGPKQQTNYSDVYVKNRDYYYFKNRCYGNCDSTIYKPPIYPVTPMPQKLHHTNVDEETSSILSIPTDSTWKTSTATTWHGSNTLAWALSK